MDRNVFDEMSSKKIFVALRKESVDRNLLSLQLLLISCLSLSARRAWIEMCRKMLGVLQCNTSLSARRAWIEIAIVSIVIFCIMGSLSARRAWIEI